MIKRLHRLGLFSYLNAWPLLYNIDSASWRNKFVLLRQVPSVLNASLEKSELDVASVSSSFYLTHQSDYKRLRGVSISSFGPVTSVLLVYTATWQKAVQAGESKLNIGLTDQSATSVELLKWWWAQQNPHAARPVLQPYVSAQWQEALASFGAVLLIGDDALKLYYAAASYQSLHFIDLAEAWQDVNAGLPFVFGVWVARNCWAEANPEAFLQLEAWFAQQATLLQAQEPPCFLKALAASKAQSCDFKADELLAYWHQHLNYGDSPQHESSLNLFHTWLSRSF